jgi:uncharacterized protein (UPF0333 family)
MRLKKYLISLSQRGQVTLEFFILLCVVAAVSIIGGSSFFTRTGRMTNSFMNQSLMAMEQSDIGAYPASIGEATWSIIGAITGAQQNNTGSVPVPPI